MLLTTEEQGEISDVTAVEIKQILSDDSFGKFAVLSASDSAFLQAGNEWNPGPECKAFLKQHRSDPWVLEYRDAKSGGIYRAAGWVTIQQVESAFLSYQAGDEKWKQAHTWEECEV